MRLERLRVWGFRNLADAAFEFPPAGLALLGPNGQGKTNLLEAICYPVLFRSFRRAGDGELVGQRGRGAEGFRVELEFGARSHHRRLAVCYRVAGKRKQIELDGVESTRLSEGAGAWLAVTFLPEDVGLASGTASERRYFLDRMLALADRRYLRALSAYRAALAQRNSALRQKRLDMARAFDAPLAEAGAYIAESRMAWVESKSAAFAEEVAGLSEPSIAEMKYLGNEALVDPTAWPRELDRTAQRDAARGVTSIGPHRDDLALALGGRLVRQFGSTGQQRSAAVALRLLELETLRSARQEDPVLLLDDVFSELDSERQDRLAARLGDQRTTQVFLTAPRPGEIPARLGLPVATMMAGTVSGLPGD